MVKIISILLISIIGIVVTGYDFFALITLTSLAIDIYKSLKKLQKRFDKYTKDKTVDNQ